MGVSSNDLSALFREDSFDDVDSDKDPGSGARGTHAATYGREGGAPVGESDEGYWGKQYDPASGMTYYLNENVGRDMLSSLYIGCVKDPSLPPQRYTTQEP